MLVALGVLRRQTKRIIGFLNCRKVAYIQSAYFFPSRSLRSLLVIQGKAKVKAYQFQKTDGTGKLRGSEEARLARRGFVLLSFAIIWRRFAAIRINWGPVCCVLP